MTVPTRPEGRPSRTPRWVAPVLIGLAIAALAFAVGRFSTFGSGSAASPTPANDSAEAGFARDMQVHHAQAIEMAMDIYRKTDDDTLRMLSYDIATGQSAQRGQMYEWLVQWGLPQAGGSAMSWMTADGGHTGHGGGQTEPMSDAEARAAMGMATDAELAELRAAEGKDADCLFLSLMIRHHEGAIPMAEAVLELGSERGVLAVAQSMKDTQTAEIDAMESASARLACS